MQTWIDEHYKRIFGLIYVKTGSFEDAKDITQDTFLTAILKKDSLKNPGSLKAWLDTIAKNTIASYYRKKKNEKDTVSLDNEIVADVQDPNPKPEEHVLTDELQNQLDECLLRLPKHIAYVTILGIVCGLSQKDCAEILNIPVTTVNNRLYKARQLLKKERGSIMERSSEIFEKLLMESRSKVDKVLTYLNEIYDAIGRKDFDRAEQILQEAPALAGDNVEAHLHIARHCHYVIRVENAWCKRKRESLFVPVEQEFKLMEKLNFEGYMDLDTGQEVPKHVYYYFMAEVYTDWGKYDKALVYACKAVDLGMKNNFIEGEIYLSQRQYEKARDYYLALLESDLSPFDRQMILNRVTLCYKRLGDSEKELDRLLKEYDHLLTHDEITCSGFDLGEYEYEIALLYAKRKEPINMLSYLEKAIRRNPKRIEEIKEPGNAFEPYKDSPEFRSLITTNE
jgi:RNA polymerase sigma-70 factor (ECF subfamily)